MGVLVPACSLGVQANPPLPVSPTVVDVVIQQGRFEYPSSVPAGRVIFQVRNADDVPHRLTLLPLPENLPPLRDHLRSEDRRVMIPYAGMPSLKPGERGVFAVDLTPGRRYALLDLSHDNQGRSYARQGLAAEFRVKGTPSSSVATPDSSELR